MTQDPIILNIIKGYKIPFLQHPQQFKHPYQHVMTLTQKKLVKGEIMSMLEKGAIIEVSAKRENF